MQQVDQDFHTSGWWWTPRDVNKEEKKVVNSEEVKERTAQRTHRALRHASAHTYASTHTHTHLRTRTRMLKEEDGVLEWVSDEDKVSREEGEHVLCIVASDVSRKR